MTRDELIAANAGLVHAVLRRHYPHVPEAEREDLIGWGTVGLVRAADSHHARPDVPFSMFAWRKIHAAMRDHLRACYAVAAPVKAMHRQGVWPRPARRLPDGLLWPGRGDGPDTGPLDAALDALPERMRRLLLIRFAVDGMSLKQAARLIGLSPKTNASRMERRALDLLREKMGAA